MWRTVQVGDPLVVLLSAVLSGAEKNGEALIQRRVAHPFTVEIGRRG